jgi:hypothetical protein
MSLLANMQLDVAASYRLAMLEATAEEYGLTTILRYIQKAQFETHNAYHNADHCIRVALRFAELMSASGWRLKHDVTTGMIAAFFHDFGHTGKGPDINNIEIAVKGMYGAQPVQDYFGRSQHIATVEKAIRCTEFRDGGFPIEPTSILECCLRDADLMESMEPHCIQYVMHDLCEEMGVTIMDAIPRQIAFLQNAVMYTQAGEYIWKRTLEARVACIEAIQYG